MLMTTMTTTAAMMIMTTMIITTCRVELVVEGRIRKENRPPSEGSRQWEADKRPARRSTLGIIISFFDSGRMLRTCIWDFQWCSCTTYMWYKYYCDFDKRKTGKTHLYIGLPKMFLYQRMRWGESPGEGGVRSHGIPTSIYEVDAW